MAAGLGFKDFATGEVLTSQDVDGYLMQGVWVFASAAARDAAVTSPQEGNFAYLKDTNVTTYYTGSAWANLDTTGMTNPMTTTGDIIYSSPGSTPVRLGIGSTNQVLTVAGGVPTWANAGGGGKVLQVVTATTSTGTTVSSTTMTDTGLSASITPSSATSKIMVFVTQPTEISRSTFVADCGFRIMRGATSILEYGSGGAALVYTDGSGTTTTIQRTIISLSYLDSPATTSSTTYKTQGQVSTTSNSASVTFQQSSRTSTITLMEIGA